MFGWFKAKPALSDAWRDWIDWRIQWLRNEFGDELLLQSVTTPTAEFFPDPYFATREDVQKLFVRLCKFMRVEPAHVQLQFYHRQGHTQMSLFGYYSAGVYTTNEQGQAVIWIEESQLFDVERVIATCAHELAHVHLLGDGHCSQENDIDHEHLTDLFVIYSGLGIFAANTIRRDKSWTEGYAGFTSTERLGYMTMPEASYALARAAHLRNEKAPPWIKHLRADVRSDLKYELGELFAGRRIPWSGTSDERPASFTNLVFRQYPSTGTEEVSAEEPDNVDLEPADATEPPDSEHEERDHSEDLASDAAQTADELFVLGLQCNNEGRYHEAISAFTAALHHTPDDSELYLERAKACWSAALFDDVLRDTTHRLKLKPKDPMARRYRAAALLELKRYKEALDDLDRIQSLDLHAYDLVLTGLVFCGMGDLKQALREFHKAIIKDPFVADAYLARSRVYTVLGEDKLAQQDHQEMIRRNIDYDNKDFRDSTQAGRLPINR